MFALNSKNEIVHIKDALTKTNYFCAKCGGILRVRNGKIKIKHFYHLENDCGDKGESLIHRYWKEYFSELKEFEGFKIIDSRIEVRLLDNTYIPDVILKTDDNEYIIIEICYKNPKTFDYIKKFIRLSRLKKVYEITVDFDKIIEIKEIYDRKRFVQEYNYFKKYLEYVKKYLIDIRKGGLKFCYIDHYPSFEPVVEKYLRADCKWEYNSTIGNGDCYYDKKSITPIKSKIFLSVITEHYKQIIRTAPFYINIYNKEKSFYKYGELYSKKLRRDIWISVVIIE